MLRIGLILSLIPTLLAGPWLCCCTAMGFINRLSPEQARDTSASAPECPGCCGHATLPEEPDSSPVPGPCPCRHHTSEALGLQGIDKTSKLAWRADLFGPFSIDALPLAGWIFNPSLCLAADEDLSALPTLSTSERLHLLHILRC